MTKISMSIATFVGTLALVAGSLVAPAPAHAALDISGTGTIDCYGGGTVTVVANVVTGHTTCQGGFSLPNTITGIGPLAFFGSQLDSIQIPASVSTIGTDAFRGVTDLRVITFAPESSYTIVKSNTFSNIPNLERIDLPNSVIAIEGLAFNASPRIVNLPIPVNVATIALNSFDQMAGLQRLAFLGNAPLYGGGDSDASLIFMSANPLTFVSITATGFPNTGTWKGLPLTRVEILACSSGGYAAVYVHSLIGSSYCSGNIVIPNTVTSIADGAFYQAANLISITFQANSTLTSIGARAFDDAVSLESITIPASVTSVGEIAFLGNMSLTEINVEAANANYSSVDGVLFNKSQSRLIAYPIGSSRTAYGIPSTVTSIALMTFRDARDLTKVTIPSGVSFIDIDTFRTSGIVNFEFEGNAPSPNDFYAFRGVAAGAVANIKYNATGFGTEPTWSGLVIVRAARPSSSALLSVVDVKTKISKLSKKQVVKKLLSNGLTSLQGVAVGRVVFDSGSAKLDSADLRTLKKVIAKYKGKKGTLVIVGYTEFNGQSSASARQISLMRAKKVAKTIANLTMNFEVGYLGLGARDRLSPSPADHRVQIRWIASETGSSN